MKKIFVIGSANTDMVIKTDQLPRPGETKLGGHFFMNAGGKGANQAVAAARLGGNVTLIAKLGNDIFGKQTIETLQNENIQTGHIFFDDQMPSGTALIMVNEEGENCIAVAPGANANLLPPDIEKLSQIGEAAIILVQLEIPMQTVVYIVNAARLNRQKLIINPAPAQKLGDDLLQGLYLITPNETEAFVLTGVNVHNQTTASEAASYFLDRGVENVIITMGAQGAYFQNNHLKLMIPAPKVKAIDTTAAGDVFCGALTVALTEMMDWERAIGFAVRAASISVTRMGAQSSIPFRKEIIL